MSLVSFIELYRSPKYRVWGRGWAGYDGSPNNRGMTVDLHVKSWQYDRSLQYRCVVVKATTGKCRSSQISGFTKDGESLKYRVTTIYSPVYLDMTFVK